MVLLILLLFTTPILVLRKFLSTILLAFSIINLVQLRLQPGDILSQRTNAHRILQRRYRMRELELLQPQLIFLNPGLQIRLIQVPHAVDKIDFL
jgi:hypothetical protein